ncbi:MAG: phosphatidate cytidylyltransferase [Eubacterium sp.]|nr:phosphatidate cytidylyltransferase [Eubacterium sp.]
MFWTRLISGIVLLLALVLLFVVGNPWLLVAIGLLSLLGIHELMRVFGIQKKPSGIVNYIAVVAYYTLIFFDLQSWVLCLFSVLILMQLAIYVFRYPKYRIDEITKAVFSFFYVAVMLSYIPLTRTLDGGAWLVWLIIIGSWGADTCAYVFGKLFGKHHFSELSPKKTIEGCVGGVFGSALIAFIYSLFFPEAYSSFFMFDHRITFPIIAAVCAVVSMVGDLSASAIKRNYDIKDYGKIIPGHGGVLDRFDSVIFVAPFVYYLLVFIKMSPYLLGH